MWSIFYNHFILYELLYCYVFLLEIEKKTKLIYYIKTVMEDISFVFVVNVVFVKTIVETKYYTKQLSSDLKLFIEKKAFLENI